MAKKKQTDEEILEGHTSELQRDFDRWYDLYENGGSDPFWSDGVNLDLVHNHICIDKRRIKELCDKLSVPCPELYYKENPPEVSHDYYAKNEKIIKTAREIIAQVESTYDLSSYKQESNFVRYFSGFKKELENGELAYVRRFTFDYFAEHEAKAEKRLHNYEETELGQLGLFKTAPAKPKQEIVVDQSKKLNEVYNSCLNDAKSDWTGFLDCAANLHKHNFINQAMIFGQDKETTLVAAESEWNRVNRYLNFNAKPIVTILRKFDKLVENRLFDISQTYGDDVNVNADRFLLAEGEAASLNNALASQYKIQSDKLNDTIKRIIAGACTVVPMIPALKPYERLVKNSIYYVVCKKLGILPNADYTSKFQQLQLADNNIITSIGKYTNSTAYKILKSAETQIENIRSRDYEQHSNNKQRDISDNGLGLAQEPAKRDSLQARIERAVGNADIVPASRDSTAGGQLSFGALRQSNNEIHGGNLSRPLGRADAFRNSDEPSAQQRERVDGVEALNDGTDGKEKPSSDYGQFHGDSTAPRADTGAGGGIGEGGALQGGISNKPYGNPKEKFAANIQAIETLIKLEVENRHATEDERMALSKYLGWGGLSDVFDQRDAGPDSRYARLKSLLSEDEYTQARTSTLTAFYTEPYIVSAMHQGLVNLGVEGEVKLLEPAMGIGKFFEDLPIQLQNAELHGVELDSLTGRIARQLHLTANIQIKGYQNTSFSDNLFDVCVGNIPFGEFKVSDEKHSLLIHDYFFAKSIDKVKPNGVIAFITSKGTLDKGNPKFRKYMAERCELLGAVRLPYTAFKAIAGTEVTTDIIFLRKYEKPIINEPNWVYTGLTENNVPINEYYLDNPQNLMGEMVFESSQFGQSAVLKPIEGFDLQVEVKKAIDGFTADVPEKQEILEILPADSSVKNFTYTIVDNSLYFRENETMSLYSGMQTERIKSLHSIREAVRDIIFIQSRQYDSFELSSAHFTLNRLYDSFVKRYGYINDKVNKRAFSEDSDYPLMLSIEQVSNKGGVSKSKMFSQATIKPKIEFVPKSYEDLITLSMSQLGRLDIEYMATQYNVTEADVTENLKGKIFLNPLTSKYETAEYYLSGNVKEKLDFAKVIVSDSPQYQENVDALTLVQPTPLTADEIDMKLGSSFIDIKYYKQFIYEKAEVPQMYRQMNEKNQSKDEITLTYNNFNSEYTIYGKNNFSSVKTNSAYGTDRKSFFALVEESLNLKDTKVYDIKIINEKEKPVLNIKETRLARQKQELIRSEFKDWLLSDAERAMDITQTYNDIFNVYKTQVFDGSKLFFEGMSDEITLRPHQKDAVARSLYSGRNVLLGHVVGSGKTYTMAATAMELKRIGLVNKPLFAVPNHLTEQWGSDFLKLYPNANILVAKKKDFEPLNRKRFIGRICTGEYDAVIIGHTQFEKIPMSPEYVKEETEIQIREITSAIAMMKEDEGSKRYSIKQMEAQKESLKERLKNLDKKKKDNVITFEETGIDQLFVDEAHNYKNCYIHTKMSNVAGITTTSAQKSFDMLMKTKYISNKNDGKGVVFATGTPISNSMTEMFVMQRYLQPDALRKARITHFDQWASDFGETVTAWELKPEGTGQRLNTRFAKFHNLPELINMFTQVADIKVAGDLDLPTPKMITGKAIIVKSPASMYVRKYIDMLAYRAERIRNGEVDSWEDNMLKITNEGKSIAIDPRIIDPSAPVDENSKVYKCCNNIYDIWNKTTDQRGAQLVFSDVSTPNGKIPMRMLDGISVMETSRFINLYEEIKLTLIKKGIPESEIAFIHDAKTDERKAALFAKVRSGEIRVLLGSTSKMGAGTNVQERLAAVHHMDCPWRPADIEQRDGRILRQGNLEFDEVYVFRYITENTFDGYLWQIQENKQKFITQIMTNKSAVRSCDDIDGAVLDCAEIKMLATGNPRLKEKMQLDNDIYMLQIEKSAYVKERTKLQSIVLQTPQKIETLKSRIDNLQADIALLNENKGKDFSATIGGVLYDERSKAGEQFNKILKAQKGNTGAVIGNYCGFDMVIVKSEFFLTQQIGLQGSLITHIDLGESDVGNITRIENIGDILAHSLTESSQKLSEYEKLIVDAGEELVKPFSKNVELIEKIQHQVDINSEMELEKSGEMVIGEEESEGVETSSTKEIENEYER